jgi:hypothetical protein
MVAHRLPEQFAASGVDATFLVPEAPKSGSHVSFPNLQELLTYAGKPNASPVVAVGHSAAHMTIRKWLGNPRLKHIILLDALYGTTSYNLFKAWAQQPGHTLQIVGADCSGCTGSASRKLAGELGIPYHHATSHMGIVENGEWTPALLRNIPGLNGGISLLTIAALGFIAWGAWRLLR